MKRRYRYEEWAADQRFILYTWEHNPDRHWSHGAFGSEELIGRGPTATQADWIKELVTIANAGDWFVSEGAVSDVVSPRRTLWFDMDGEEFLGFVNLGER